MNTCISPRTKTRWRFTSSILLFLSSSLLAVYEPPETSEADLQRLPSQHLPNLIQVHPKVYSGGLPTGDEAFEELSRIGIRTIISVDAATPDVDTARRHGLRYVHLPHGYDGIRPERVTELAKAVKELQGPIYIHCHHGKHRSPTASSVACVAAGLIPESQAIEILQLAGTDPHYRGLYRIAGNVRRIPDNELAEVVVEYHETAPVTPLAEDMVRLEAVFDLVQQFEKSGWKPASEPENSEPTSSGLLLAELFLEMLRGQANENRPVEYMEILESSQRAALAIYETLKASEKEVGSSTLSGNTISELRAEIDRIALDCKTCHHQFRDQ